jgi:hypothetical protein
MSTFKDITYKKNHDETWTEWSKRVPDNDEDKLDYIEDTIYEYCQWGGERTREMTDMMLQMGVEDLIPLLDNEKLLLDAIEDAYLDIRAAEKMNPKCIKKYKEEVYKQEVKPVKTLTVAEMIEALSKLPPDAKLVMTESGFYSDVEFAEVMLPEPYIVGTRKTDYKPDMPDGTQVYRIGHSKQWY